MSTERPDYRKAKTPPAQGEAQRVAERVSWWSQGQAWMQTRPILGKMYYGGLWLLLEQALRLGLGFWVGAWVARYLGPGDFGELSAALAIVAVVSGVASLGLNAILVRDIARHPAAAGEIQATAFFLKLAISAVLWLGCLGWVWYRDNADASSTWLVPLAAFTWVLQSLDVVDRGLQAQGQLRQLALIRCAGVLASCVLRVSLVVHEASVAAFALAACFELAVAGLGYVWAVRRSPEGFAKWAFSASRAHAQWREGLPLMCAGVATLVQGHADQIMLSAMSGSEELGRYAAALRIVTLFSFVPIILQTVASPTITLAKAEDPAKYRIQLGNLYRAAMVSGLVTAGSVAALGPILVDKVFGEAYAGAGSLLPLLSLRLVLTNIGVARSVFLTTEGMAGFVLLTASTGAVLNLGLNLVLVPRWGAEGAILASLASFTFTTFGLEWAERRARWNFRIMVVAILRPWRAVD
jgi:O-antigen/teichoic acid export membrane protein